MARRPALAAAATITLLTLLTGCVSIGFPGPGPIGGGSTAVPSPSPTPTAQPSVPASIEEFYAQHVDWTACGNEMECAMVLAPMDWQHPGDGRTIELMNFFHFDGAEMTLRHITLTGVSIQADLRLQTHI